MSCQMTQNERLLAHLKKHHFITRLEAAAKPLYIMNLWSRVAELEEQGYRFDRRPYTTKTGKHVLQYWLREGRQTKRAA
jgi:hypothetical protein